MWIYFDDSYLVFWPFIFYVVFRRIFHLRKTSECACKCFSNTGTIRAWLLALNAYRFWIYGGTHKSWDFRGNSIMDFRFEQLTKQQPFSEDPFVAEISKRGRLFIVCTVRSCSDVLLVIFHSSHLHIERCQVENKTYSIVVLSRRTKMKIIHATIHIVLKRRNNLYFASNHFQFTS